MPTINNPSLTITALPSNGADLRIKVTYSAVFSVFERHLAGLGLVFQEQVAVLGVDPTSSSLLTNFPNTSLPVTDGTTTQTITRSIFKDVTRAVLQEDTGLNDADEIRCRIRIAAIGLPPAVTPDAFTNQTILQG